MTNEKPAAVNVELSQVVATGRLIRLSTGNEIWVGLHKGRVAVRIADPNGLSLEFLLTRESTKALIDLLLDADFNQPRGFEA